MTEEALETRDAATELTMEEATSAEVNMLEIADSALLIELRAVDEALRMSGMDEMIELVGAGIKLIV